MVKDDEENFIYIPPDNDFVCNTYLTIKYDEHGQVIGLHDPNRKKKLKGTGGWTTYFVRIERKQQ